MPIGTTAAILAGVLGGTGMAAGALSNKSQKSTQSSSTTTTLPPELQGLNSDLIGSIMQRMQHPETGNIQGLRTQGIDAVNKTYSAIPQKLTENFASRGFGSSGGLNHAMAQSEFSRAGDIAGVEQNIADMINGNEQNAMGMAANVVNAGRGTSTTATSTTPGNVAGGALTGGMNGIISGMLLKGLLKG